MPGLRFKESAAKRLREAIREAGGQAVAQRVDVAQRVEVDGLIDRAISEWGGVDVMANVAGIPADGDVETLEEAEFDL